MILVDAWVPGTPRTKGSLDVKGGHASDTPQSKRWRALLASAFKLDAANRRGPFEVAGPYREAVAVEITAYLPPPPDFDPAAHGMAPVWRLAGDVDKLARNVLDALALDHASGQPSQLAAGVIVDDNLVVDLRITKFVAGVNGAGMTVRCSTVFDVP